LLPTFGEIERTSDDSRITDEVAKKEGEAAVIWLSKLLEGSAD